MDTSAVPVRFITESQWVPRITGIPVLAMTNRMAPYSSFRNPSSTYGDRQKPDLVAPGGNVQEEFRLGLTTLSANSSAESYSAGPWLMNTSGTSFSSPVVAGGAALLMQRSRRLKQWPEAVKAILAATAMQMSKATLVKVSMMVQGSIMLDRADHAAGRRGNAGWSGIKYNFNRPVTLNLGKTFLVRGKRARVAIAWNQNPNYSLYSSMPCADLDLQIILPNGSLYTGSYSYDNNLEIVDFRPPTSGNYTIRVKRVRMDMSPRYLGFAWYQERRK